MCITRQQLALLINAYLAHSSRGLLQLSNHEDSDCDCDRCVLDVPFLSLIMSSNRIKSLVCISLTTEDWNTFHEIAEDAEDSVSNVISAILEATARHLREEAEYIDSLSSKSEEEKLSFKQYETPSLFL